MTSGKKRWKVAGLVILSTVALLCAAGAVVLRSQGFRNWALGEIIQQVEQKTGTHPEIQSLDLRFFPFAADFHGVVIHGNEGREAAPLFQAPQIRISLRIFPLLRGKVQIDQVILEKPQVAIRVDANGRTNVPARAASSNDSSGMSLAVHYAQIRDGVIHYNDLQIPLAADVYDLQTRLTSVPLTGLYHGELNYSRGSVRAKDFNALDHSLELRITANASQCKVDEWKMVSAHSALEGSGIIENYESPVFMGTYKASVAGGDVGFLLKTSEIPIGNMELQGNLKYETPAGGGSFLDGAFLEGAFHSAVLSVRQDGSNVNLRNVGGRYNLKDGMLRITKIRGEILGGKLISDSNVIDLQKDSGSLHVDLRNASLSEATKAASSDKRMPRLVSVVNGKFGMNWKNGFRNSVIDAKAEFSSGRRAKSAGDIPIDGTVDATYGVASDEAVVRNSVLKTGATELNASGTVSKNSSLRVRLASKDLHELVAIFAENGAAEFVQNANAEDLRGRATFEGKITGRVQTARLEGHFTGTEISYGDLLLSSARANVVLDSNGLKVDDGIVESNQGRVQLAATIPLRDWTLNKSGSLTADVKTEKLSVAEAQRLANISYPLQGLLTGELHLTGSVAQPSGKGHFALSNGMIYGEPVSALNADFQADANTIRMEAQASAKAGEVHARGMYEMRTRRYELNAEARDVSLAQLSVQTLTENQLSGTVSVEVSGKGTLDDPQLDGTIHSTKLQVRGENISSLEAKVTVQRRVANFEVASVVEQSPISAKGSVALTGDYMTKATVDTGKINIGPFLQKYLPGAGSAVSGDLELHATLNGPLKQPGQMQGQAEIATLRLSGKNLNLQNSRPMRLEYAGGTLTIRDASMKGAGTELSASGTVPLQKNDAMNVSVNGNVDLKILQDWIQGSSSAGQAQLQLLARGTFANPDISGDLKITNVAYSSDSMPIGLESLNGDITIRGKRLEIQNLSGAAGGGTIDIGGTVDFSQNTTYALTLNARSARVRQNGIRAGMDADLNLHGAGNNQVLDGRIVVHKLSFNEGSDLGEIIAQLSGDETVSEPSEFAKKIKLNVSVQSDEGLGLVSSQLSVSGGANLRIVGTAARPVVLGRVSLTGGEVFFLGKRFELQGGTIGFANTARTRPILNLYVRTTVEEYNITISLSGPFERLKTNYTSDPALPTGDIINLLAFGQTTTESASKSSAPASVGAESAVASAVGGQLAGQLQKVGGISQLTIDPLAGNNQNPGSQIAIQQRVTGNLLITFSTDITSAQSQSIQLKYQAKRNVSISILRDENGGYGMDIRYHKAF